MSNAFSRKTDVPIDYVPYENVSFCGNTLVNTRFIFEIRGSHPLLVGKGLFPYVWINAPSKPNQMISEWERIVERSTAKFSLVQVNNDFLGKKLSITVNGITMLNISNFTSDSVIIDEIDLRPIGISMFGSSSKLEISGNSYMRNTATDCNSLISIR